MENGDCSTHLACSNIFFKLTVIYCQSCIIFINCSTGCTTVVCECGTYNFSVGTIRTRKDCSSILLCNIVIEITIFNSCIGTLYIDCTTKSSPSGKIVSEITVFNFEIGSRWCSCNGSTILIFTVFKFTICYCTI